MINILFCSESWVENGRSFSETGSGRVWGSKRRLKAGRARRGRDGAKIGPKRLKIRLGLSKSSSQWVLKLFKFSGKKCFLASLAGKPSNLRLNLNYWRPCPSQLNKLIILGKVRLSLVKSFQNVAVVNFTT